MSGKKDELYEIYEQLKRRRIVLNKEEFAKKLGYSRAQFHRIVTEDRNAKKQLITKAKEILNETKNVSPVTVANEDQALYGHTLNELLALLKLEKESFIKQQDSLGKCHDTISKQQETIQTLAEIIKPPNLNNTAKNG